jgi:hypothetical protein
LRGQFCDIATPRAAPVALWRVARWFVEVLHNLFGGPAYIAWMHTLRADEHKRIAEWLACAEAMLRRLLLIEAAAMPKPNTRPLLRTPRQRVRRLVYFEEDKPENWAVRFRVLAAPRRPRVRLPKYGPPRPRERVSREDRWCSTRFKPCKLYDAWPLALRYEAVLRVYNDPFPYARRLARQLYARPHRHAEALAAPPKATHRIDRFDEMRALAQERWRERRSSA